jgi:agmatine deiminase
MKPTALLYLLLALAGNFSLAAQPQATPPDSDATMLAVPEPPPDPVRTMAEWEEVQAVVITWTAVPGVLTEIVRHAVSECQVIIITETPDLVAGQLATAGIPLDNVQLLNRPFNTVWIRDYGPWTVYADDVQSPTLIDWIYNRPQRIADDTLPQAIAAHLDITLHEATETPFDWVHAGGNHLVDGMGTAFSSDLVIDENPTKTEAHIDAIAEEYLGIQHYVKLPKLPFDGIHHLDMHMRLLDEETLLVGQYPEGVADGPQIEANIQQILTTLTTPFGHPYRIVRIPMPPDQFGKYPDESSNFPCRNNIREFGCYRTYTNSLFINNTVLVPTYDHPYDSIALAIYEQELPGYNIVGIDCNPIIPQIGAIHCITKLVGSEDPLWIAHPRLTATYNSTNGYPVLAKIRHQSGIAAAQLKYRTTGQTSYQTVPMIPYSLEQHLWGAQIPPYEAGTTIEYYITATANNGKQQTRPMPAPEGFFSFEVKVASTPPVADFAIEKQVACAGSYVRFLDQSDGAVDSWNWSFPGGTPSNASIPDPVIFYENAGTYPVSLTVTNDLGTHTYTRPDAITIQTNGAAPFFENFESDIHPGLEVVNPTHDDARWEMVQINSCSGKSYRLDNYFNTTWGTSDILRTRIDANGLADLQLHFDVAYAAHANVPGLDRLQVNVIDCAGTRNIVYSKTGHSLATAMPTNNFFIPTSCEDWREETIDLSAFAGQQIIIEFENAGFNGNMLYIDNIDIATSSIPNQPPSVNILPLEGGLTYVDELPLLPLEADATDMDGMVDSVQFFVNGQHIGTTTNFEFTIDYQIPGYGIYQLQAKAYDNDEATGISKMIIIQVDQTTLTSNEQDQAYQFRVYPVPAHQVLKVDIRGSAPNHFNVAIADANGQQLRTAKWEMAATDQTFMLDLSALSNGTYLLSIFWDEGYYHHPFVVQH